MRVAIGSGVSRDEYSKLCERRDKLIELLKVARVEKHRVWISGELDVIREQIKNAHREQYSGARRHD